MPKFDILISGFEALIPGYSVAHNTIILINEVKLVGIHEKSGLDLSLKVETEVDGKGKSAVPGFINFSAHSAQTLLRESVIVEPPLV